MSRKLIGLTTLAAFLLAVMVILAVLMGGFQRRYRAERAIEAYSGQLALMDESVVEKHRDLARWYNFCLAAKEVQPGYQEAYGRILNISDGIMGYLELPDGDLPIPIYHNASLTLNSLMAGHVPGSALPVGGRGNHTVLTVPEDVSDLAEGDIFGIHIPGDVLYYTVREVKTVSPGQTRGVLPVAGEDRCTLTATMTKGTQTSKIQIQGVRLEGQHMTDEASPGEEQALRLAGWAALAALLIPGITGGIGVAVRWAVKRWNCRRLTKYVG